MRAVLVVQMDPRPILVVGDSVAHRWDLAWAFHEAGIPAEQACSADQARHRLGHGRLAGVVLEGVMPELEPDDLARELRPDPDTGDVPFVLAVSRTTTPSDVVDRVRSLLQASCSSEPK